MGLIPKILIQNTTFIHCLDKFQALMCIVHGLHEHLNVYSEMATFLGQQDILVFGHDIQGHGMSGGDRGIIDDMDEVIRNILLHCQKVIILCYLIT